MTGPPVQQVQHTPDNPMPVSEDQQAKATGLTKVHEDMLVKEIIQPYRTQWATERILRMPTWLKNTEFDKGRQVLGWDPASRTYFDAIAWYRQNNTGVDYSYLEKYINNITQTVRRNFVAAMSRGVPPVVVQPENAENLADSTTAKAAQEVVSIVERENRVKTMVRAEAQLLFLYGVYFKWTRFVIDGTWMGYKNEPIYGDVDVSTQSHFHCTSCGVDTPAPPPDQGAPPCANCGVPTRPEDFYQGDADTLPGVVGTSRRPNGMVKWSIFSPLQVDVDPTAETISQTPILALDMETDVAELRAIFPAQIKEIAEGQESATDPNASYSRLVRTMVYSNAYNSSADIFTQRATFTQVWVQPTSYYRSQDPGFIAQMQKLFPYGCKVSMCGATVLDIKPAVLEKEWTCCLLHEKYGLYPPSIADNVVPFNERFNNVSNILDDYMERCATGITMADPRRLDVTQMSGKAMSGAVLNPVPSIGEGINQPMNNALVHYEFKLDPGLFDYLDRLWNYCQIISGVPPQVSGTGTTEGVETAKGQKQMLDQALGTLGVIWDNVKDEHASAGQNAIECLQANMAYTGSLWNVIKENGSEYRNDYVHLDEMQGRIRVYAQTDEGLPLSPEQKRAFWTQTMELASKEPESYASEMMAVPTNQQLAFAAVGMTDAVSPTAAQRSKTLQVINRLLQAKALPTIGPNGQPQLDDDGTPLLKPSIAPDKWVEDYKTLEATVLEFLADNCDLKQTNPDGWNNVIAYYRLAITYAAQVDAWKARLTLSVKQAGMPQPPGPSPQMAAAAQDAIAHAVPEIDRLAVISQMPPLPTGSSLTSQVAAAGKIIDTGVKAAQLMQP